VAHCLTRLVFCLFAEDVSTLPEGLFSRLVDRSVGDPERFPARVRELFAAMVYGGEVGSL
jgi:MmeI, helicase spacer domain